MLEINKVDYRYRLENDEYLLAYNVITNKMYFFKGNTKKYLESMLYNKSPINLESKYINYLINNNILKGEEKDGI